MRHGFRALVVDDDDFSRQTAVRILKRLGAAEVAEAASGADALRWADSGAGNVDLVLCDLRMPELDGIETLEGLASRCRSATFVLASGVEARLLRAAAGAALRCGIGALHVVGKPVTMAKMAEIVATLADAAPTSEVPAQAIAATGSIISADDVREGIAAGELLTFYQPKLEIRSNRVQGAEALIRWRSPRLGLLAPAAFLGIAQANGLLDEILYIALANAGADCAAWRARGARFRRKRQPAGGHAVVARAAPPARGFRVHLRPAIERGDV